jgi:uncharacterized protein YbaP (TraB family)
VGRTTQWLLALGLLGSLSAHAASPVWALRGAHNTLYLAGSVHLLPSEDAALPAALERAYASSAKLVMELDLARLDPVQAMGWMTEHGALPAGASLHEVLGAERYARVSAAAAELGLAMPLLEKQAPWVVAIELADLEYLHLGFDPQHGVEEQLLERARTDGKTTAGLETLDEELGGFEALSREDQLHLLDQTVSELKDTPAELKEVLGAWRRGETEALAALLSREYHSFPALYRQLVSGRNERWLPQLKALLQADGDCLVVVGALHLVGKDGLLELLRRSGFTPTQMN